MSARFGLASRVPEFFPPFTFLTINPPNCHAGLTGTWQHPARARLLPRHVHQYRLELRRQRGASGFGARSRALLPIFVSTTRHRRRDRSHHRIQLVRKVPKCHLLMPGPLSRAEPPLLTALGCSRVSLSLRLPVPHTISCGPRGSTTLGSCAGSECEPTSHSMNDSPQRHVTSRSVLTVPRSILFSSH